MFRVYSKHVRFSSAKHGLDHAVVTAELARLLAEKECPDYSFDAAIGGCFHDIGRVNDQADGDRHAFRSSQIAEKIIVKHWKDLRLKEIIFAIRHHADGKVTNNKLIGCIWDADRLSLSRLGIKVNKSFLSTKTAKRYADIVNGKMT